MEQSMTPSFYHLPVMPDETIQALNIKPDGIYADGTLGGGGHSELILKQLENGKLLGIDRDVQALEAAKARLPSITAVHGNFHDLPEILREQGIEALDGILLDLGVSSYQLDTPERGFSYRFDGSLDMRMDQAKENTTAADIVNTYSQGELTRILYQYGEEKFAPRIARALCTARESKPVETTQELVKIIEASLPAKARHGDKHPVMRTFMALRIAVNDELAPLESSLRQAVEALKPCGRIVVITFHSLEDRIVKHTFRALANPCRCPRDIPYCVCGKEARVRVITRNPVLPGAEELSRNSRAHSAKLRTAEKI
jgi:16S rRNA (cytosine1402-N4)-methyltransferase